MEILSKEIPNLFLQIVKIVSYCFDEHMHVSSNRRKFIPSYKKKNILFQPHTIFTRYIMFSWIQFLNMENISFAKFGL